MRLELFLIGLRVRARDGSYRVVFLIYPLVADCYAGMGALRAASAISRCAIRRRSTLVVQYFSGLPSVLAKRCVRRQDKAW